VSQAGSNNGSGGGGGGAILFVENFGTAAPAGGMLNILGGTGISTSGSGNTVVINAIGEGETWNVVSTNQAILVNNGYVAVSPGGALTFSLPATSPVGSTFTLTLDGATSWQVTQGAGQQIRIANNQTTSGATGTLISTQQGDTIMAVCTVANTRWNVIDVIGNITVV